MGARCSQSLLRPRRRWALWAPELRHSAGLQQAQQLQQAGVRLRQEEEVAAEPLRQEAELPVVVAELVLVAERLRRLAARHRHLPGILEVVLMAE